MSIRAIWEWWLLEIKLERLVERWTKKKQERENGQSLIMKSYFAHWRFESPVPDPLDLFSRKTKFVSEWDFSDEQNCFERVNNKDYSRNILPHLNQPTHHLISNNRRILPWVQLRYFVIPLRQRSNEIRNVSFEKNSTIDGSDWDNAWTRERERNVSFFVIQWISLMRVLPCWTSFTWFWHQDIAILNCSYWSWRRSTRSWSSDLERFWMY